MHAINEWHLSQSTTHNYKSTTRFSWLFEIWGVSIRMRYFNCIWVEIWCWNVPHLHIVCYIPSSGRQFSCSHLDHLRLILTSHESSIVNSNWRSVTLQQRFLVFQSFIKLVVSFEKTDQPIFDLSSTWLLCCNCALCLRYVARSDQLVLNSLSTMCSSID